MLVAEFGHDLGTESVTLERPSSIVQLELRRSSHEVVLPIVLGIGSGSDHVAIFAVP